MNAVLGEPVRVTASLQRLIAPIALEDVSATLIEYASGQVGFASANMVSAPSDWVHVYGTECNLLAHTRAEKLFRETGTGLEEIDLPVFPDSGVAVLDQLVRAVKEGVPPETGGREGLLAVAVLEASILSAERGCRVDIDEVLESPAWGRATA